MKGTFISVVHKGPDLSAASYELLDLLVILKWRYQVSGLHIILNCWNTWYTWQGWGSDFFFSGSGSAEKNRFRIRTTLIRNEKKIFIYFNEKYLYYSNSSPPIWSFGFIQEFSWMEILRQSIVVACICWFWFIFCSRWK